MTLPLFPFRPNWRRPVVERLGWLTDVLPAETAKEQRRSLRERPRRTLAYDVQLLQTSARARLDALLWANQSREMLVPIWTDAQRIEVARSAGGLVISGIKTAGFDFEAGYWAVLWHDNERYEVLEIDEVTPTSIIVTDSVAADWPAGSLLYPARRARLPDDVSLQAYSSRVGNLSVRFDIEPAPGSADHGMPSYRGLPVNLRRPNWRREISTTARRTTDRIDVGTGPVFVVDVPGIPAIIPLHRHQLSTRADIVAWRGWLHACAGRFKPFWQPSWTEDLEQSAPIASGATAFRVRRVGVELYEGAPGRRDLAMLHRNGQWTIRRINDVAADGAEDVLTLDAPLGFNAAPGDFRLICWLMPSRLDADEIEIAWNSVTVAETEVALRSLPE